MMVNIACKYLREQTSCVMFKFIILFIYAHIRAYLLSVTEYILEIAMRYACSFFALFAALMLDSLHAEVRETFTDKNGITFVFIPGGSFQMGDEEGDLWDGCHPVHTVTVSPFVMSIHEITNEQYARFLNEIHKELAIMATDEAVWGATGPWTGHEYIYLAGQYRTYFEDDCKIEYRNYTFSVKDGYEDWPVTWVSWYGAKAFAKYYGFDLPTEAEWEFASRCGARQLKYGTDDGTINSSRANYKRSAGHTTAVGSYPPTPYGLFDISGNVWEWCSDWYSDYTIASVNDPTGPPRGLKRVFRGGSYLYGSLRLRSAARDRGSPWITGPDLGFRVVLRP